MFKVVSNIEPPPRSHKGTRKYPWDEMKQGDSFEAPFDSRTPNQLAANLGGSAKAWALRHDTGAKFQTKVMKKGVRIWRVE